MESGIQIIHPGKVQGTISAPPSKSVMQRVLATLLVRNASMEIRNPGNSADDRVLKRILEQAGFLFVEMEGGSLMVTAPETQTKLDNVDFGDSGLAARMLTPILALQANRVLLNAAPSLLKRPMPCLDEILPQLGVVVMSDHGHLPASIRGPLLPLNAEIDGSISSQFLTGMLMSYSAAAASGVSIHVNNLVSKPYIDITLRLIADMGMKVPKNERYETFYFPPETNSGLSTPQTYTIEGDWSAAAFLLVAGATAGPVVVTGLGAFSVQPDKLILTALMDALATISIESTTVTTSKAPLKSFHFNATDCPDLFPPLAVLACHAEGTSVIEGVNRLVHKESNRAATIQSELGKMGATISIDGDLMIIRGGIPLKGADVDAHNDHRIAMMCAIAALCAKGPTTIHGADAVSKSYPAFFHDLQSLGADLRSGL